MCALPGPHLPGEEGAMRVPEEQTLPHQAEDPGIRQSDGLERRLQLKHVTSSSSLLSDIVTNPEY